MPKATFAKVGTAETRELRVYAAKDDSNYFVLSRSRMGRSTETDRTSRSGLWRCRSSTKWGGTRQ